MHKKRKRKEIPLIDWLNKAHLILAQAYESFQYVFYLGSRQGNVQHIIQTNRHWRYINYLYFYNFVIEINKLYSESSSQHFNFISLIDNFNQQDGFYKDLPRDEEVLKTLKWKIFYRSEIISKLKTFRNQIYAHTDGNAEIPNIDDRFFRDINHLFEDGIDLINTTARMTGLAPQYAIARLGDMYGLDEHIMGAS